MAQYKKKHDTAKTLLRDRLREVSALLEAKLSFELASAKHGFQSGGGLEEFFREKLKELLPANLRVNAAEVLDGDGFTCGSCDVVLSSSHMAPPLSPSLPASRHQMLAIENTYGIIEVQQTLTIGALNKQGGLKSEPKGTLWESFEKVAAFKELRRTSTEDSPQIPPNSTPNHPFAYIFFYQADFELNGGWLPEAAQDELSALIKAFPKHLLPDGICVLGDWFQDWHLLDLDEVKARSHAAKITFDLHQATQNNTETTAETSTKEIPGTPETPASKSISTEETSTEETSPASIPTPKLQDVRPEDANFFGILNAGQDSLYALFIAIWSAIQRAQLTTPNLHSDYGGEHIQTFSGPVYALPGVSLLGALEE